MVWISYIVHYLLSLTVPTYYDEMRLKNLLFHNGISFSQVDEDEDIGRFPRRITLIAK